VRLRSSSGARAGAPRLGPVDRAYLASSRALSGLLSLIGVAMLISTLARGGGPLALGVVLGALFAVLGAARLYMARGARAGGSG